MLDITPGANGEILFSGRFDASQVDRAKAVLLGLKASATLDFSGLDYISSAGLGILLAGQKALSEKGFGLRLKNLKPPIRDIFHFSGFDQIFEII